MRVWLLQGRQGEDPGGLGPLLRAWAEAPEHAAGRPEVQPVGPVPVGQLPAPRADLLVLAAALCPDRAWVEELLARDVGLLAATPEPLAEAFRDLAEAHPVFLIPPQPTAEVLALALRTAAAGLLRHRHWKAQVGQLQQRLNDRIVIERAKGVLVQRLRISEEEAYKRLRVQSRRQRRQIRDVAQSLLDSQALLLPDLSGLLEGVPPAAPGSNGAPGPADAHGVKGGGPEAKPTNPANPEG